LASTRSISGEADADAPRRRSRKRSLAAFAAAFLIGALLCLGLAGAALYLWDAGYEGRVLAGVDVGGVDLSGLDREQASAKLLAAFGDHAEGGVSGGTAAGDVTTPVADVRRADITAMVDAALAAGRSGSPAERAFGEIGLAMSGRTIPPRLTAEGSAVGAAVDTAVDQVPTPSLDSGVATDDARTPVTPPESDRSVDAATATAAAKALETLRRVDAAFETKAANERMTTDVVVTFGKSKWTIKAAVVRSWLHLERRADGSEWPAVDPSSIPASLKGVAKAVTVAPVSAGYVKDKAGKVIGVVPAANGRTLDQTATAKAIAANVSARGTGSAAKPVKVVVAAVQPKVTTAAAQKSGSVMTLLGAWKTWFPISDHNFFGANIWQPAKFIDGTVLAPGQTFEWWSAIGPVTRARGFGLGGFIAGDHTEPTGAMGGGMCSSSTTLFNAALRAGLKINERSNHRYYINRYPLGLDATVSGGRQTMSFTNDMKNPILIRTYRYRSGGKGWVRYEIWGVPDGRTVSLGGPVVSNRQHATTHTVRVSTLRRGVGKQTEYPSDGMNVAVSRVVRDAGGAILHSETFRSHYTLWNGRIEIGR
jgi:vancomycin resistance protein YoaR